MLPRYLIPFLLSTCTSSFFQNSFKTLFFSSASPSLPFPHFSPLYLKWSHFLLRENWSHHMKTCCFLLWNLILNKPCLQLSSTIGICYSHSFLLHFLPLASLLLLKLFLFSWWLLALILCCVQTLSPGGVGRVMRLKEKTCKFLGVTPVPVNNLSSIFL